MMRSATDLSKADLHVFSKLFDDGLERGQEAEAFSQGIFLASDWRS